MRLARTSPTQRRTRWPELTWRPEDGPAGWNSKLAEVARPSERARPACSRLSTGSGPAATCCRQAALSTGRRRRRRRLTSAAAATYAQISRHLTLGGPTSRQLFWQTGNNSNCLSPQPASSSSHSGSRIYLPAINALVSHPLKACNFGCRPIQMSAALAPNPANVT